MKTKCMQLIMISQCNQILRFKIFLMDVCLMNRSSFVTLADN